MDDQRVMVVYEEGLDWRFQLLIEQQPADVKNIDRPGLVRHEIGARQFVESLRKGMTCATDQATARHAELARQRGQSGDGAQPGAAVLIALESVPPGDHRRRGLLVPARQGTDVVELNTAYLRRALGRVSACRFHKGVKPQHVLIYERAIQAAESLQLH